MTKFCKDCRHFSPSGHKGMRSYQTYDSCHHPSNMSDRDIITGESHSKQPIRSMRSVGYACGPEALLFEPKQWRQRGGYVSRQVEPDETTFPSDVPEPDAPEVAPVPPPSRGTVVPKMRALLDYVKRLPW